MVATGGRTQEDRLRIIDGLADTFRERMRIYDDAAEFPYANFEDLRQKGMLTLTVPEELGGEGLLRDKFVDFYEILEHVAIADSCTAQMLQVHSHCCAILAFHASAAQQATYFSGVVLNGELFASAGSEAGLTSKKAEVYQAELAETSAGFLLNCTKHFTSLAPAATHLLLWVALPGSAPYGERLVWVVVPRTAPEVELVNEWDTLGMRSTVSWGVNVKDYPVSADSIIGEPGAWLRDDPRSFTLAFAANHLGAAQGAFNFLCDWVRDRPYLAASELVKLTIGEMSANLYGTRCGLYAAARLWEQDDPNSAELASIKALHLAKAVALEITTKAFDICGARASFRSYPLEQIFRDVRTFTLHFRDDLYMQTVGTALLEGEFSAKGYLGGSTPVLRQA